MSAYTNILGELAALPEELDRQLAASRRAVEGERRRREGEIERYASEHEAILRKLREVLDRAPALGIDTGAPSAVTANGDGGEAPLSVDPVAQAKQLVDRLEETLDRVAHTRRAIAAEEERLAKEARSRTDEQQRRQRAAREERERQLALARSRIVIVAVSSAAAATTAILAGISGSAAGALVAGLLATIGILLAIALWARLPE